MSYFSDLSIQEEERRMAQDYSYPSHEMQIEWMLGDLVTKYLDYSGSERDIIQACSYPSDHISDKDYELLYSSEFVDSPATLLRCIRIAWNKLNKNTNENTPMSRSNEVTSKTNSENAA